MSHHLTPREQRVLNQAKQWLKGVWEHNTIDGECTPDFGCCTPSLRMKTRDRAAYWNSCIEVHARTPGMCAWIDGQSKVSEAVKPPLQQAYVVR